MEIRKFKFKVLFFSRSFYRKENDSETWKIHGK